MSSILSSKLTPEPSTYDGKDGIWGTFKLNVNPGDMEDIAEEIAILVRTNPPIKSLLGSLIKSWLNAQGIMPTFFNCFQFFSRQYYMERHLDSSLILSICKDPALLKILQVFLGNRFLLWRSEIWISQPGREIVSFWHQDRYEKLLKGSGRSITAYIALTEVNEHNGMEYMPQAYVQQGDVHIAERELKVFQIAGNHQFTIPKQLESQAIPVILEPSEFVLFDDRLIHRSIKNRGLSTRISMAARFVQDTIEVSPSFSPIQADPILITVE
jgi:hypothetical protein